MSHEVPGTRNAVPFLENWSFNTVSKISSLGNLPIFLPFANGSTLRETPLEVLFQTSLFLNSLQLFLNFQGFIGCQGVNVVDGLAVAMQALFTNLEEGLSHRCFHINLNMVGQDFSTPGGTQVHVQGGDNGPLDVSDSNWFSSLNKHGFKDTPPQVNLERCQHVGPEGGRDRSINFLMSKAIEGQETGFSQLDQKAVVISSLDTDNSCQFEARFLISPNFRNAKVNSRFIAVLVFMSWLPGISVCGVTKGSAHKKENGQQKLHGPVVVSESKFPQKLS